MPPITDDRHLFADEQAYIAHKRYLAQLEREEALKQAQARKKRRRVQWSKRIYRAKSVIAQNKYRLRIRSNPLAYQQYLAKQRECKRLERINHPERVHVRERRKYLNHRDDILLSKQVYYLDNREKILARQEAYYAEHREEILAHLRARRAAKKAAKKAAKSQPPQPD